MSFIYLLLLVSATSAIKVTLIDGNEERNIEIKCNGNENVNILRNKLVSNRFIGPVNETHDWRILSGNVPLAVNIEQLISAKQILDLNCNRIIFSNIKNKIKSLNIKIGKNEIKTIQIDTNEKLSKVREYLNKNGLLGSQSEKCVNWKFHILDGKYVTDESQMTAAQLLENSKKDQLEITDAYSQDNYIQLYVYAGLKSLLLPKISLAMNLFDLHSMLSGEGTCIGRDYNFVNSDWLILKKTANLSNVKLSNADLQISPDLIFTQTEEKFATVRQAYFKSRNGRYGVEYVSKTSKKRNIIGEVVEKYSRSQSPKVSVRVEKNNYCYEDCNKGVIFDPVMLDNVQSTSVGVTFTSRVVICQEGTAIRFVIDTQPRTPFWITVKHDITNSKIVNTRGDYGQQSYWAYGYTGKNIVVHSHVIVREEDLSNVEYMPTYVVEVYELLKPKRWRRNVEDQITVPHDSTNKAATKAEGKAFFGSGTDEGFGPGKLLMEVRFMLLTFKSVEIAQEIIGRGVSRFQQEHTSLCKIYSSISTYRRAKPFLFVY